jgi:UDP-N-acetylmuramoylalanine-D-glutamate ligase
MFRDYAHRGRAFAAAVAELTREPQPGGGTW